MCIKQEYAIDDFTPSIMHSKVALNSLKLID